MTKGFTLIELLVTMAIFVLVLGGIFSGFLLSERAYREGESAAELTQNGRVILERMAREIRQAREIASDDFPATRETATSTLEFEDGNIAEGYHYIRYFQDASNLKREVKRYYFSGDPDTFVLWNDTPPPGEDMLSIATQEPQIVGEFIQELKFWSQDSSIIDIFITLEKQEKRVDFSTEIFGRNL